MRLRWLGHGENENLREYLLADLEDAEPWWISSARMLVDFVDYVEQHEHAKDLWVVTSMQNLIFTSSPTGGVGVKISAIHGSYQVEYPLLGKDAPWPGAIVIGRTKEVSQAVDMLTTALQRIVVE